MPCAPRDDPPSELAALCVPPEGSSAPPPEVLEQFVCGTSFVELAPSTEERALIDLFARLRYLFEWHMPEASVSDAAWASRKPIDSQTLPGPRWKAHTLASFLHAQQRGLPPQEAERIFVSICGKGGTMDVIDFAEACAQVGRRVLLPGGGREPAERGGAKENVPKSARNQHGGSRSGGRSSSKGAHGGGARKQAQSIARPARCADEPAPATLILKLLERWEHEVPALLSA